MMKMRQSLLFAGLILLSPFTFAQNLDITGKWRTIDDVTGFSKAIVEIEKDQHGTYYGTVIQVLPRPGYVPKTHCTKCVGKLKNYPIVGFPSINNLKRSATDPFLYENGAFIDPLNGRVYKGSAMLNDAGTHLTLRAHIGIKAIGRTQTWIRVR